MPEQNPLDLRRRDVALLAALALLILLGAAGAYRFLQRPETPLEERTLAAVAPQAAAPASTFEDILRIFSALASDPLAFRFAQDFKNDPALNGLWARALLTRHAHDFARGLRDSPEFSALLRRYAQEPNFKELVEKVAGEPPIAELLPALRLSPSVLAGSGPRGAPESLSGKETADRALRPIPEIVAIKEVQGSNPPTRGTPNAAKPDPQASQKDAKARRNANIRQKWGPAFKGAADEEADEEAPKMGDCPPGTKRKPGVTGTCAGNGCAFMCDPI